MYGGKVAGKATYAKISSPAEFQLIVFFASSESNEMSSTQQTTV